MSAPELGRVLRAGDRGRDVKAVKRALAIVGYGPKKLSSVTDTFGPYAVKLLKRFQASHGLAADGVYGAGTHAKLVPSFDSYAAHLYVSEPLTQPGGGTLQLPETFVHTHQTGGLPGFPAVDVFAKAGTVALSPADGQIDRLSGRPPSGRATPGGPYGLSCYLARSQGGRYFLTHFGVLFVKAGDHVRRGQRLGTLVDWESASGGVTPSHIHEGFTLAR